MLPWLKAFGLTLLIIGYLFGACYLSTINFQLCFFMLALVPIAGLTVMLRQLLS